MRVPDCWALEKAADSATSAARAFRRFHMKYSARHRLLGRTLSVAVLVTRGCRTSHFGSPSSVHVLQAATNRDPD